MIRKRLLIIIISIIMFSTQVIVLAAPSNETPAYNIRLPTDYVTINAQYDYNSTYWFKMKLSNIRDGFDITNGSYYGWCIQKGINMTRGVDHTVNLYSSYGSNLPVEYNNNNWDKVNYVINHKIGVRENIQKVIWYYISLASKPTYDPIAMAMINDTDLNGNGYIPQPGDYIAILAVGNESIQRAFLELKVPTPATLGDFVWNDINHNGIQDNGEPGISNIEVRLLNETQTVIDKTFTNNAGYYAFNYVDTGNYSIQFILKSGYKFSPKDVGTNDAIDSDANTNNGKTDVFPVVYDVSDTSWDAGMYQVNEQGQPSSPPPTPNHAPTADATAGEPYIGYINEEITFNGSRSYDLDGYIANWTWNFGDGTNGYGKIINHAYSLIGTYDVVLTVKDNDNAIDSYKTNANIKNTNLPPSKPVINGPINGKINTEYDYTAVSTDPDNDTIQYTINWGDKNSSVSTSEYLPSNIIFSSSFKWSEAGKYIINVTASDKKAETNSEMIVYISTIDVKDIGYLTDENGDGIYDLFHQKNTNLTTKLQLQPNGNYKIDYNGDGIYDYEYNTATGQLSTNVKNPPTKENNNYLPLIIGIIVVLLIIFIIIAIIRRKK